jgi:predicted methyltransferase
MKSQIVKSVIAGLIASGVFLSTAASNAEVPALDGKTRAALEKALTGEHRSAANKARDRYRHPLETLAFFGFRSDMTVVEIWPGGGWYTEILAAALKEDGKFYAAQYSVNPPFGYQRRYFGSFLTKLGSEPDIYRDVVITSLGFPEELEVAPPGSADMVVTFRNVHNWVGEGYGPEQTRLGYKAMYDALKPGGILGIVDHRWPDPDSEDPQSGNGYISEQRIIEYAQRVGFELVARSEVNANPNDTRDHPRGVWTLPPSFAMGDSDRDRYAAIGESDRMTLKFVKPR